MPDIDASEWDGNWQDPDEGIGDVRIVAREQDDYESVDDLDDYAAPVSNETVQGDKDHDIESIDAAEQPGNNQANNGDIIVLYILARSSSHLMGDKINSAAQANGLSFGQMNIFHRLGEKGQSLFAMANMVEPGSFDPDSMHEMETPGLTMFMRLSEAENNLVIFEDMLECAYHMSEMLGAQIGNRRRQPLTQGDAEQYRELATGFDG